MKMLMEQEMYSCGPTSANRKNWPTKRLEIEKGRVQENAA
jgi:hypothetical protein